jgi:zinc/manganese transport system ATP-binding protein
MGAELKLAQPVPVIGFQNLTLGYGRHPAVHHLSGAVATGDMLAVIGPNGAGKSTLLKGISGALSPLEGCIQLHCARHDIAYLPQLADVNRQFPMSVHEFVAMGFWRRMGLFGGAGLSHRHLLGHALEQVGLSGFEQRSIGTLSGGQMQRMLFARLIVQDARVILLDEPFTAMDTATTQDLMALVKGWGSAGRTVIAVLHDLSLVRGCFSTALLLAREPIAWGRVDEVVTARNLDRAQNAVEVFDQHAGYCVR